MIGDWNGLDSLKAIKPGHLSDGAIGFQHCCDRQDVIDGCLECHRKKCSGDCSERKARTRAAAGKVKGGVDMGGLTISDHLQQVFILWLEWRVRQPDNQNPERTREILKGVRE